MTQSSIFAVRNLSLKYGTGTGDDVHAVNDVSFDLQVGDVLGIAGESGCGKSTLATGCLSSIDAPLHLVTGTIELDGQSIIGLPKARLRNEFLGSQLSTIPQGSMGALNPMRKVARFAQDVMFSHRPKMKRSEISSLFQQRLKLLGLDVDKVPGSYPCELSGGMKQRVVIAVSTLMNPKVVVADEPTSALDVATQKSVITMLKGLVEQSVIQSMIFITHELPLLGNVSNKIAIMYAGEFVEQGETKQVLSDPVHPYTKALLGAMLVPSKEEKKKPTALKGIPPKLTNISSGCPFAPRCPVARDDCKKTKQEVRLIRNRQVKCAHV